MRCTEIPEDNWFLLEEAVPILIARRRRKVNSLDATFTHVSGVFASVFQCLREFIVS